MLQGSRVGSGRRSYRLRRDGFSMLELLVVIVIIAVLFTVAVSRLLALQVDAERVTMETIAGNLRSALGIKVAESIVKQNVRGLASLEGTNPMDRLAEVPVNYLGALDNPDIGALEDGNWYFDTRSRSLVYLVRNKSFFEGGLSDPPRARFAIRLVYADRNSNGRYDADVDAVEGLRLAVLEPYRWTK